MSLVTKPILLDETGRRLVEAVKEQNAILTVMARDKTAALLQDWAGVQQVVRGGAARAVFGIGDFFEENFIDTASENKSYEYPWRVNDFKDIELESGEVIPALLLQGHWATPFGVQFSHQRAFLACPEGLAAGTYYFTFAQNWGSNCVKDDAVSFTLTEDVPAGGRIAGCYSAPDVVKTSWKIYVYAAGGKTLLETITPAFEAAGTSLGVMQYARREGNLNSMQEMAYGWNRWKTSAMRQWLNSEAGAGEWWQPQDAWDIAPEQLATKAGFLSGLPEDMKAAMKSVKVITYANTVNDGGEMDITFDKVFLPSLQEMFINPQIAGEGEAHAWWKRAAKSSSPLAQYGTYPQLIHYACENHASPQYVRLRSAYRGNAFKTWYVGASGSVSNSNASHAGRCAPLVCIG